MKLRSISMMGAASVSTLALLFVACASTSTSTKPAEPASEPAAASPGAKPPVDKYEHALNPVAGESMAAPWADYAPVPPDGQWLVDLQGREYFVQPIPKREGEYRRIEPTKIRVTNGFSFDIEREDDSFFYAKIYRRGDEKGLVPHAALTAEDLERIEKSYEVSTPSSESLSFEPLGQGLPTKGQWRNGFALADVDGDGALDLVHGPPRRSMGGRPVIFRGDGKGGFVRWKEATFPAYPYDYGDAATGDFNGDGKIDLAFAIHLRGLVAMLGDGKGNFSPFSDGLDLSDPARSSWSNSPFTSRAIEVTDWNGDGKDDIIAISEGPARAGISSELAYAPGKRIYLASESGWVRAKGPVEIDPVIGDAITTGDFNGDKRSDFATGISFAGNRAILNLANPDGTWRVATIESLRPGAIVRGVAAGDVNGDHRDDLFVSYVSTEGNVARTGIDLMLTQPGGWRAVGLWSRKGRDGALGLGIGDIDGDGRLDVIGVPRGSEPVILRGLGRGEFALESPDGMETDGERCAGHAVALVDLDGDRKDEIVVGFADERCSSEGSLRVWKTRPSKP